VALLAGGTTLLVGGFCTGLVGDVADTLFLCYCIDRAGTGQPPVGTGDMGRLRREEVKGVFEYGYTPLALRSLDIEEGSALASNLTPEQERQSRQGRGRGVRGQSQQQGQQQMAKHPETIVPLRSPLPLSGASSNHNTNHNRQGSAGESGMFGLSASRIGIPIPVTGAGSSKHVAPAYSVGSDSDLGSGSDSGSEGSGMGRTPKQGQGMWSVQQQAEQQQQQDKAQEEEDDLDPFAGSVSGSAVGGDGEEEFNTGRTPTTTSAVHKHGFAAFLPPQTTTATNIMNAMNTPVQPQGTAHQALAGRQRMMTSTQELNVKSHFLMDLNASASSSASEASEASGMAESRVFGMSGMGESQRSVGPGQAEEREQHEEDGEGSELGPGSDFFK